MLQELFALWPHAIGYLFAALIAQIPIWPIMDQMWKSVGSETTDRPRHWHSQVLGMVERVMFVGSFQLKKPEFIGIWLAIKVASQWAPWSERVQKNQDKELKKVVGRELYNIFLLGNALSIIYSAVGAKMIVWLNAGDFLLGIFIPILLLVVSGILLVVIKYLVGKHKKLKS